jgi:hypothetical protein
MDAISAVVTFGVGVGGVVLGSFLARRNDRRARADLLLAEAFNDAASAIAEVAGGVGDAALRRYASATSRIALHASPRVIAAFRSFQNDPQTITTDGRQRLVAAMTEARRELGLEDTPEADLAVLLFGGSDLPPFTPQDHR